ncbi:glycoside hydrolase family 3 protein [Streptomyces sp. NPDC088923]|uniref:glycoside hydrolase family 3 protein n=1 Tax=Streptomyces sp. NPDC088923 TaxID=3365913 RepID=UPI0037FC62BD
MTGASTPPEPQVTPEQQAAHEAAVETALARLDLDTKTRLLAGQDFWSLPAIPEIGLDSLVVSDGPIGVRGVRSTSEDPSLALPSPTALGATWSPEIAVRAGQVLAQEARRKGVHVLLAPTVNLHRSPLGGRHFEAYSEDPYLTGAIGTGYVRGVQSGGVGTTTKHFVGNDAETDRFTVDNRIAPRPLRELYLAPFEAIVANAHPWGIMTAYNTVNGTTMTAHHHLVNEVLRGEWDFDGVNVSDWTAARDTVADANGGLDLAMPGPKTVYGENLAAAVRAGDVEESVVDAAVRRVLLLAARTGALKTTEPVVPAAALPAAIDGEAFARELATRSFVLVRNDVRDDAPALPLAPGTRVALSGAAAREARILGGGSATVFPAHVVSPLDGLRAALPEGTLSYEVGADPNNELDVAGQGFALRAVCRDEAGEVLADVPLAGGHIQWMGSDLPEGVTYDTLHSIEVTGTFTPRESGEHVFGTRGIGGFKVAVAGRALFEGSVEMGAATDPFEAFFGQPTERGRLELAAGEPVELSVFHTVAKPEGLPIQAVGFTVLHQNPVHDPDELIARAAEAARGADTAVVVVATTERVESEGFDRADLKLPGRQDDLVRAVAAANPRTVVVVNAGSPVEMPWRDEVAAVLLSWFPGQEGGAALADVLTGAAEPGGRLPTTWPTVLEDAPVVNTTPTDGKLEYTEGVLIGYRAWEQAGRTPAYPFGHGLGYTDWTYESVTVEPAAEDGLTVTVRVRNSGSRTGRETVQVYLAPAEPGTSPETGRPARWLAGFAQVEAAPGESAEAVVRVARRAFEIWDEAQGAWRLVAGDYGVEAGRSVRDLRVAAAVRKG